MNHTTFCKSCKKIKDKYLNGCITFMSLQLHFEGVFLVNPELAYHPILIRIYLNKNQGQFLMGDCFNIEIELNINCSWLSTLLTFPKSLKTSSMWSNYKSLTTLDFKVE